MQQVALPRTHLGSRAISVHEGVPPLAQNVQPLELLDEVVEEPLLLEEEELEEELEEGAQTID